MMRKFLVLVLALAWSGCKKEDDNPGVEKCTADQLGAFKCTGSKLMQCNGTQYNMTADCALNTPAQTCHDSGNGVARCQAVVVPGEEGDPCASNPECGTDLVCSTDSLFGITAGLETEICVDECANDGDCDATEYCDDVLATESLCWPKAESENGGCVQTAGCPAGLECWPITGRSAECLDTCNGDDVYTVADCTGGAMCLPGTFNIWSLEDEPDPVTPANPKACPNENECTSTFQCITFSDGKFCVRPRSYCGLASPIVTNFTQAGLDAPVDSYASSGAQTLCGVPGESWFCGTVATGNAEVECAPMNSGFVFQDDSQNPFECNYNPSDPNADLDCALVGGECVNWNDGPACGFIASLCVAYCETEDGTAIVDACPAGQQCGTPAEGVGYPVSQMNGDTQVTCTTPGSVGTCDGGAGFSCVGYSNGNYCVRDRKVCGTTGVTP